MFLISLDVQQLRDSVQLTINVAQSKPISNFVTGQQFPDPGSSDDASIEK